MNQNAVMSNSSSMGSARSNWQSKLSSNVIQTSDSASLFLVDFSCQSHAESRLKFAFKKMIIFLNCSCDIDPCPTICFSWS